jgi:predicted MFS family arabinose efflux permease
MASATTNACGAIGFGLAGIILAAAQQLGAPQPTNVLFIADGATFGIAALLVLRIPSMGGGIEAIRVTGSLRRAWSIAAVRPHLAVSALAAFLLAISFPALLALAYKVNSSAGPQTYSALEVVVSVGVFAGAVAVGRSQAIGSMRTAGVGLLLTGVFSLAMTLRPSMLLFVAGALFIASIGNPIYTVANQTALIEAADPSNRGTVMASRFGVVQTAMIAGTAAGGLITGAFGALAAYGVLAIGLILLGMFAIAAGRRSSNPLHGRPYEEATLMAAGAPSQAK